ncbi:MAG: hypothetical protein KF708_24255 [Pirellulales bacterium]|nr:hypothetical protein [Pirellulales bacterium]
MQDPNIVYTRIDPNSRQETPVTVGGVLDALRIQRQRLLVRSGEWLRKYEARQPIVLELPRD